MECCCYLRNVQDLLAEGKLPYERRFGEPLKGPIMPFGAMIDYHPSSPKDLARIHQFGKKILPGIFLGYDLIAGGIWKGDILIANLEEMEKLDCRWYGTAKLSGRDYELRVPTLRREPTVRSEDLSGELQGNTEESRPADPTDDAEARNDFWSIQGDFIHHHHNEPRVQLYVPKDETFPILLKYIDVTRSTHTDLDVLQGKKIDCCWNIDSTKLL